MHHKVEGEGHGIPFDYEVSTLDNRHQTAVVMLKNYDEDDLRMVRVPKDADSDDTTTNLQSVCLLTTEMLGFIVRHFAKHDPKNGRILLDLHVPGWEPR